MVNVMPCDKKRPLSPDKTNHFVVPFTVLDFRSYTKIFKASPLPNLLLVHYDSSFFIEDANLAYLNITGNKESDLIGKSIFETFPYSLKGNILHDYSELQLSLLKVINTRKQDKIRSKKYDLNTGEDKKNFSCRYWETENIPVLDNEGNISIIIHVVVDVTSKEQAQLLRDDGEPNLSGKQAALQKECEARDKEALINSVDDLIWSVSRDFKLSAANRAFIESLEMFTGVILHPGDDLMRQDVFSDEYLSFWKDLYSRALLGESFKKELFTPSFNKSTEFWTEINFNPIYENGIIVSIACYSRNVTERRIAEEKIKESEYRYRAIIEQATDAIYIADASMKYIDVNSSGCLLLGYSKEEFLQLTPSDIVFEEDLTTNPLKIPELTQGESIRYERRFKKKDGSAVMVEANGKMLEDGRVIIFARDVSDYKKAEESNRFKAELLNTIGQAVIATDLNGTINFWNKAAEEIYGWRTEDAIGNCVIDLIPSQQTKEQANEIMKELSAGHSWSGEFMVQRKDGLTFPAFVTDAPIYNQQHVLTGVIGVSSNISKRKETERQLKDKDEKLENAQMIAKLGYWQNDLIKNTLYWSDEVYGIWDINKEEIPPDFKLLFSKIHPDDKERFLVEQKAALNNVRNLDIEHRIILKDGSMKWVHSLGKLTMNGEGRFVSFQGTTQDIDARKMAELAVIEVLDEKNIILESIGDAFFAVDKNWMVTYWNKQAEATLLKSKMEMIHHNLWDVFSDAINSQFYEKYHLAVDTNQKVHFEDYYEPVKKWYEVSAFPSNSGLSVYFKDVTERKFSEIRLNELNKNLEEQAKALAVSNAELEQFAYVASHDLQEPLRMVTSFLTLLEKRYAHIIDLKGQKYIHFAVDGAKRMRRIILDLLEFSRVGRTDDQQEDIDLNELVHEIQILFGTTIAEKEAVIEFDQLPVIHAHTSPIRQVFQNIIGNALKYSKEDTAPRITITSTEKISYWQFTIRDNGIGISPEYFDKIFIIFQRLHTKEMYSGTGMGLAVTKKVIENLGGKVWVESEEGKGSAFHFTLLKQH